MGAVLTKAGAFLLIIALGYVLKRRGMFTPTHFGVVSGIVLNLTLPCAVVSNFAKLSFEPVYLLIVPFGILLNLVMIGTGYLAARGQGGGEKAFNMINFSGYNIGCFTMPYVQNFLGPVGVVSTCLFDAGNSLLCTGGTYSLASLVLQRGEKPSLRQFLKRMFSSVPLDTYLVMLLLSVLGLKLPVFVTTFTDTVGAANGFLAMLMIGIGFELRLKEGQLGQVVKTLSLRYGIAAVFALVFWFLLPLPLEVRQVLTLVAFAPIAAVSPAFTQKCGGDVALSSTINSISIVLSITIMTALLLLMQG